MIDDIVLDTTIIIDLFKATKLHLLGLVRATLHVTDSVKREVRYVDQAAALADSIEKRHVHDARADELDDLRAYARLVESIGQGEASCLALANRKGWRVATDDRRTQMRRMVRETIGRERIIRVAELIAMAERDEEQAA